MSRPASEPAAAEPASRAPARARFLLRLAVTAAFVALILWLVDLEAAAQLLASADLSLLLLAYLVAWADRLLMLGKWYPLLHALAPHIPFGRAARAYLAASAATLILPSTIGPDALRAAALGRRDGRILEVGASVVAERLLGLVASCMFVALAIAVGLWYALPLAFVAFVPVLLLAAVGVALVPLVAPLRRRALAWLHGRGERWQRYGARIEDVFARYGERPGLLAVVFALTLVEQLFPIVVLWILGLAIHAQIGFVALLVGWPVAGLIARIPVSLAGLGPADAGLIWVLGLFGVSGAGGLALVVIDRLLEIVLLVPAAVFWREIADGLRAPVAPEAGL